MAAPTRPFSARLDTALVSRLKDRSRRAGVNSSRLAARYIDEGLRMDAHPGVVFRDGPTGRRAALAAGPDVWEVIQVVQANSGGAAGMRAAADWGSLTDAQVRAAVRYYSEYRDEIDERIALNVAAADEAEAAWRREHAALA